MTTAHETEKAPHLEGQRIAFVGKLAGMSKRDAQKLVRQHAGVPVELPDETVQIVVVGEEQLPLGDPADLAELFDNATRAAAEQGAIQLITETELWQRLGFVEVQQHIHRLYTPAMLADLLGVSVAVIRRWHRKGLIVPAREVRRLPYFDFQEVATARRLAELLAAGCSPAEIERKLADLARLVPGAQRPLAQLSVIVEGKQLLLREGDGLIEPGGQRRIDFAAVESSAQLAPHGPDSDELLAQARRPAVADESLDSAELRGQLTALAAEMEDQGQLDAAVAAYRTSLAATGPDAVVCFQLAELLYRLGDVAAARERYYVAIELDDDYVEARANLACVLAEEGQVDLAIACFEGALAYHGDYPDVHYHLARLLDGLGRVGDAEEHWRSFLALAPESPWADEARMRLADEA